MKYVPCPEAARGLSREKERQLIQKAQFEDQQAYKELLDEHDRCIKRVTIRFGCQGVETKELVQVGQIGFVKGVYRFDLSKEYRLWTYARYWVGNLIIGRCAKEYGFSEKARKAYRSIKDAWEQLKQEVLQEPSYEEIAQRSGKSVSVVEEVLSIVNRQLSLEQIEEEGSAIPTSLLEEAGLISDPSLTEWLDFGLVMELLGSKYGPKWIVLHLLQNQLGNSWEEIIDFLTTPTPAEEQTWPQLCDEWNLPSEISRDWSKVCGLFKSRKSNTLLQWYHRKRRTIEKIIPRYMTKSLIVLLLREEVDHEWSQMAQLLVEPETETMTNQWKQLCQQNSFSTQIPHDWPAVCELFETQPPATLDEAGLKKCYFHYVSLSG